ncbi:MAG: hypothetical protein ACLS28_21290 [Clostridium neonatale]
MAQCARHDRAAGYDSNYINGDDQPFAVYTDKDGKYIDADYNVGKVIMLQLQMEKLLIKEY